MKTVMFLILLIASAVCASNHLRLKNEKERHLSLKREWINVTIEFWRYNQLHNPTTAEILNVYEGPIGGPNGLYKVILVNIVKNDGDLLEVKTRMFFEFGYGAYDSGTIWDEQQNGKFEPVGKFKRKNDDRILKQLLNLNSGTLPSLKIHVPRFPVKFTNEVGSYGTATVDIDNWLKDCSIAKVYKVMDLRDVAVRAFGIFKNRSVHHQAVLVNSRDIPGHPKCVRDSLLLHVFPKSKRQNENVAGNIEVEFIQKNTEGIQKLPKWRSAKDVTFETKCKIKNVDEMKKFLHVIWETKDMMNCWKASTYMVHGFQMLSNCSTGGSLDKSLKCVKESLLKPNKNARENKENRNAPKKNWKINHKKNIAVGLGAVGLTAAGMFLSAGRSTIATATAAKNTSRHSPTKILKGTNNKVTQNDLEEPNAINQDTVNDNSTDVSKNDSYTKQEEETADETFIKKETVALVQKEVKTLVAVDSNVKKTNDKVEPSPITNQPSKVVQLGVIVVFILSVIHL